MQYQRVPPTLMYTVERKLNFERINFYKVYQIYGLGKFAGFRSHLFIMHYKQGLAIVNRE